MSYPLTAPQSIAIGFSFNKNLASNLTYWRNAVLNQDMDCGIVVDGPEGSGKSVFGFQVAKFMDREHTIDLDKQVCYYPEQFKEAVMSLPKGKAIIWDEARRGLNRRRSFSEHNLSITDMLAECRQHNLFLIIIMPSFYDMDMYAAVWRTRILLHVNYKFDANDIDTPLRRGFFRFYTEEGKKRLFCNPDLRKQYEYPFLKNECFDGTFPHHYVVAEGEYRKRKREAEEVYRKRGSDKNVALANGSQSFNYGVVYAYKVLRDGAKLYPGAEKILATELITREGKLGQTTRNVTNLIQQSLKYREALLLGMQSKRQEGSGEGRASPTHSITDTIGDDS